MRRVPQASIVPDTAEHRCTRTREQIEQEYLFDSPGGKRRLADLFDGRSQLIIYHFMWRRELDNGCNGCTFLADHIDGAYQHLIHHDVSLVAASRAPQASLEAYRRRMGWHFPLVSALDSDFNFDYHVSFTAEELATGKAFHNYQMATLSIEEVAGISAFYRSERGDIYHTYSSYGRGNEEVIGAYVYLDLTPKGRNENGPYFGMQDWVRPHDRYDAGGYVDATNGYIPSPPEPPDAAFGLRTAHYLDSESFLAAYPTDTICDETSCYARISAPSWRRARDARG